MNEKLEPPTMDIQPVVFVVDDDPAVRESVEIALGPLHAPIECFDSAEAFLRSWEFDRPGCLVLDIRMPGMDGAELLTRVASQYPKMTRIILSGQSEQDAFERATEHAQHYLPKPCSLTQLEEAIMAHHS